MKKLKFFSVLALMLFFELGISYAQSPDYLWAKSAGGTDNDEGYSVATDTDGNIIVTGVFQSSFITFGTDTLTNVNAGNYDMFIVKYDVYGNVLWAKSAGGTAFDFVKGVTTDTDGNILVTGKFYSSSIIFGTDTLINAGSYDMFIVKYDADGNVLWAKSAGGGDFDESTSVATDTDGNIFVTGDFYSSSIIFGTDTLFNTGYVNMFIVKFGADGNVLWVKSSGGTDTDYGTGVATDVNGNIFVTGNFFGSSITFGTDTLSNAGSTDMFIVKYDSDGNVLWAKSAGETDSDDGNSITTDTEGNVLVTGWFRSSSITFGTTTLTNVNEGNFDMFIVKYDVGGNVLWAKSAGGTHWDQGYNVAADTDGNILVTGRFYSYSITFGTTTLTNAGNYDMFIVKYDADGNVLWAKSAGGTDSDQGNSISTDADGNILVAGDFYSSSITFGTTTLTNAGNYDMFIVKLDNTTGIQDNNFENTINVFPNPTYNQLIISNDQIRITNIFITNITGKHVKSINIEDQSNKYTINVEDLPTGLYILKVEGDKSTEITKFVKE